MTKATSAANEPKADPAEPKATLAPMFRKADPDRLQEAEAGRRLWLYTAPVGTEVADIFQPQFFGELQVHQRLGAWDRIEVREELGAWWAEFLVTESAPGHVVVAGIKCILLEGVGPRHSQHFDAEGLRVDYRGPHLLWCVIGKDPATTGERLVKGGFRDEGQASGWLRDHIRVKNAP